MSDFGDFDSDDAFDTEPADPEQVAMKFHRLRRAISSDLADWDDLSDDDRKVAIALIVLLIVWLRRQGAMR